MIIVQDFNRSPVVRSFHSSHSSSQQRRVIGRREIPRLLSAFRRLPLVISRERDQAARALKRIAKEGLGLDGLRGR